MFDRFRSWVLQVMRVPHEPAPPFGAPGSVRVFRAGRNYFKLRLIGWGVAQFFVLASIVFWAVVLIDVEDTARVRKQAQAAPPTLTRDSMVAGIKSLTASAPAADRQALQNRNRITRWDGFKYVLVEIAMRLPAWAFPLIWLIKVFGFALFLAQIPFTYALRRLDYELRWYIVTDRSLRIRTGVFRLQETTMSFANLQQVEVKQGPLQRLLGMADVHVQSAGGGAGVHDPHRGRAEESLHTGIFHSVDNATEVRDLILARLRLFRQAGLGDPDDHHEHPAAVVAVPTLREASAPDTDVLSAARELLSEARAFRASVRVKL